MQRSFELTTTLLVAVTLVTATAVSAQTLDPGFGIGGRVVTSFGGLNDAATAVAVQPDGKIVAAGSANLDGTFQFVLARYNPDGSLDLEFGKNGLVTGTDFDLVGPP